MQHMIGAMMATSAIILQAAILLPLARKMWPVIILSGFLILGGELMGG